MSRNGSGTYTLPSGNPVVSGTLIESGWANTTLADLATAMTDSLSRSGQGGMTAALRLFDGTFSVPGLAWASETTTGFYRAGAGDTRLVITGSQVVQFLSSGVAITGTLSASGNFAINTDKFTVAASSGNSSVGGTLGVTGNFAINTDKFTVAAATGNTVVAGTLSVTGAITATGGVVGNVSGNAGTVTNGVYTTGNQSISGTKTFSDARFSDAAYSAYVSATNAVLLFDTAGGQSDYMVYDRTANGFAWLVNSSNRLTLDSSGNLTATGNVTAYSDERLKKDWAELPQDFLERLAKVKHGTYTRIDTDERQAGASAQAMREVLPESVMDGDHLSLAYGNASLVAAIQLAHRVIELERRLALLEG